MRETRNSSILGVLFFIQLMILLLMCAPKPNKESTKPKADKTELTSSKAKHPYAAGKKIYDIYCLMCHGDDGQQVLIGEYDLVTTTLDLEGVKEVTRSGRNTMTAYGQILTQEEIDLVCEYVYSMKRE